MAVLRWGLWLAVGLLLSSSFSVSKSAAIPMEEFVEHQTDRMQQVMELPSSGTTQVCVVPLDSNTRIKVQHESTNGRKEEVVIKRKALTKDTMNILEIEFQTPPSWALPDDDTLGFSVRLNGTELRSDIISILAPEQPRTALLLRGYAGIALCPPATPAPREREMPQDEVTPTVTQGQEEEERTTSGTSLVPSVFTDASSTSTSEEPESVEEDPWWSFLLVLGKVGEVPVLALLLGGVLLGALLGAMVVCFCSKACKKRRVTYHPVTAYRTTSLAATNDVIRDTKIKTLGGQRGSGSDSAFGTLNTDTSSHMGTGTRPSASANNSIDRGTRSTGQLSVNNLGRGTTTGSVSSGSAGRDHNNPLNIPNNGVARYGSHQFPGFPDIRDTEGGLMIPHGSNRTRTSSNRSTASSVNRNTNRSPNIPYTKTLGTLTGHQDPSMMVRAPSGYDDDWDSDSDDSNYDKPYRVYGSSPIVGEYSDPMNAQTVTLQRPTDGNAYNSENKPSDRRVPASSYETFKK